MPDSLPLWARSVHHDGSDRYVKAAALAAGDPTRLLKIRIRHSHAAPITRAFLRFRPDGEQRFLEMTREPRATGCSWWSCLLPAVMPSLDYRFLLLTSDAAWWYTARGVQQATPTDVWDFRIINGAGEGGPADGPGWLADTVFYQIAPDRFHNGDPSISVRTGEYSLRGAPTVQHAWGEAPSASWDRAYVEFFGGDLKGIAQKLPYLLDLGVNALYLLPIFSAPSIHKYDVSDYENVDPHLGGNDGLARLRKAATEHGFRLILDIVPNHCGREHPWFRAAAADPTAPTAEFFTFTKHPDEYESWLGHASLPRLDYRSSRLRQYMITGPDAIFKRWLRAPYSIDGWRVDVANMLGRQGPVDLNMELARQIRTAVKSENPEAYLLAEHFFDASEALRGDAWDAAMNYAGFAVPLWSWLTSHGLRQHWEPFDIPAGPALSTESLIETWDGFRSSLPWSVAMRQFNLLGSHDTPRLRTSLHGNRALQRVAVGLLMTYPGVPCLLYGDEIGMEGRDTHVLTCMPWNERAWDEETRAFYRTLIRLRRTSTALRGGGYQMLDRGMDWLAYQRDAESEILIVIANRGDKAPGNIAVDHGGIPDGMAFRDVLTDTESNVTDGRLEVKGTGPGINILRASM